MTSKIFLMVVVALGLMGSVNARWAGLDEGKQLISQGRYFEANFLYEAYLRSVKEIDGTMGDVGDVEECILGAIFCGYCIETRKSLTLQEFEEYMSAYERRFDREFPFNGDDN